MKDTPASVPTPFVLPQNKVHLLTYLDDLPGCPAPGLSAPGLLLVQGAV